jgi:hypothetical protein
MGKETQYRSPAVDELDANRVDQLGQLDLKIFVLTRHDTT